MKTKFSKILGVGLTLALLTSLLLTAAPVSALSAPSVDVDPATISAEDAVYTISFRMDDELAGGAAVTEAVGDTDAGGDFTGSLTDTTIAAGSVSLTIGAETFTDDGLTVLTGSISGTGTINYSSGALTVAGAPVLTAITADYLADTGAASDNSIVVTFDDDNVVADDPVPTVAITAWCTPLVGGTLTEETLTSTAAVDGQEVTITWTDAFTITTLGTVQVKFTAGIDNPDDAGDYSLTVETSQEDAKTATYEIGVPDIAGLPGVVSLYNSSGILMDQKTDPNAIQTLLLDAGADFTIKVGPGTYVIAETIEITHEGLTLVSTAGAATTIIDASSYTSEPLAAIDIRAAHVTVEGFTLDGGGVTATDRGSGIRINQAAAGVTVQDNIITGFPDHAAIALAGEDLVNDIVSEATISGNIIEDCKYGINLLDGVTDSIVSGNTITGCTGASNGAIWLAGGDTTDNPTHGNTITGNTISDNDGYGIHILDATWTHHGTGDTLDDNLIEGNTISGNEKSGIQIEAELDITKLQILDNVITDNEGVGILIDSWAIEIVEVPPTDNWWTSTNAIKFNTITGNDADNDGYGIETNIDQVDVDATLNWWGTAVADDVAAMVNNAGDGSVTYEPFLAGTLDAVFSASDVAVGVESIAKDTADVAVSVTLGGDVGEVVNVISVAKYIDNPEEAIADAIAFFDVYVAGTFTHADTKATIKFYAGDAQTDVYMWNPGTLTWGDPLDADFSAYGGYVYVTVDPANLAGTPFALVGGAAATIDVAPKILSPDVGDDTVSLRPVFAWEAVPDADGYYFQLADNASFVLPLIKMEGDMGRLLGTTYAYVGEELPYSKPYHWRVKAVSGTIGAGDLAESDWAGGVFITMDEPVEPTPPVVVEPTPPAPPAPIIEPIVEVIVPPVTAAITPGWIYAIIAVGGVLVIALLVLIVRTRRVA